MDDKQNTIGLSELLDEISHDLDDFRKKHQSDYGVKNITMWWELQRERVVARHVPTTVVKKLQRARSVKFWLGWFTAGWATMIAVQTAIRLLIG